MTALSKQHEQLGQNIRRLREQQGTTLEVLAAEIDIDTSFLGYVERGERNITSDKIFRTANALKVEVQRLFEAV